MKKASVSVIIILLFFLACSSEAGQKEVWSKDETFEVDGRTYYGKEGKFAIVKENGKDDESDFPAGPQGRLYSVYFWGDLEGLVGKSYTLTATHENADEARELYSKMIGKNTGDHISADAVSGAKFSLGKPGLWLMEVSVEGENFASFIIEAE
ncbi:hypothetical protein [Thalassobacillus devorans]|uniref:hypothetical protein n=1 Tax=Thalassobacillus devorans TaxID=279813 RepID=UPI00048B264D|nr:hypothetical protein [Thalassobacillus devorans]